MRKRFPCPRSRLAEVGFTAIELLVALTLSTMLMVAVLGLLTTMSTHCRQLVQSSRGEPWQALLAEQLRRDLANARQMTLAPNQIVLKGYLGTQPLRHGSTLRAAEVIYHLTQVEDTLCLLRDERPLDSLSTAVASRQLVATGIASVRCVWAGTSRTDEAYVGSLPGSCRIQFFADSSAEPLVEVVWVEGAHL